MLNDSEAPAHWLERKQRHAEKEEGATRAGMPLSIAARLWQTIRVTDSRGSPYQNDHGDPTKPRLTLNGQARQWQTPNIPTGGRFCPATMSPTGVLEDGRKRQVSLDHQVRLWATPSASDGKQGEQIYDGKRGLGLSTNAKQWPTPSAMDGMKGPRCYAGGNPSLPHAAKQWGTPQTRDAKDSACADHRTPTNGLLARQAVRELHPTHWVPCWEECGEWWCSLCEMHAFECPCPETDEWESDPHYPQPLPAPTNISAGPTFSPTIPSSRRQLNPRFVEWLMGWPIEWTACASAATESCPPPPPSPGSPSIAS